MLLLLLLLLLYVQWSSQYRVQYSYNAISRVSCSDSQCLDLPGPLVEGVGVDLPLDDIPGVCLVTVDDVWDVRSGKGRLGLDHVDCDGLWCGLQTVDLLLALLRLRLVHRPGKYLNILRLSLQQLSSHLIAESVISWALEEIYRLGENWVW